MCASRFQYQLDYRKKDRVFEVDPERLVRDAQTQRIGGTTSAADAIATIEKREMFVGLTERFDESMVLLRALVAPDLDIRYERANVAKSSRIAKELLSDPVTRQMIVEANQGDLELYEYVLREALPAVPARLRRRARGRRDRVRRWPARVPPAQAGHVRRPEAASRASPGACPVPERLGRGLRAPAARC